MTLVPATIVSIAVLSAAGCLPVLALVGFRPPSVPLCPLAGSVVAAAAATCFVAVGGSMLGWFIGIGVAAAIAGAVRLVIAPPRRRRDANGASGTMPGRRLAGVIGALAIAGAGAWCLRGLATPTIGFDTRAIWLLRAGWFLQSHHQVMIDMRAPSILLGQTAYPPLVSASASMAWGVTGNHSMRLGVVVIALLNMAALAAAAWAVVECGRTVATRRWSGSSHEQGGSRRGDSHEQGGSRRGDSPQGGSRPRPDGSSAGATGRWWSLVPLIVGVVSAPLLMFVATGITEPFLTNGYADPIWSLAAVGAVAYGLQLGHSRSNLAVAAILVMVAGLSKDEGVATAALLVVLMVVRGVAALPADRRRQRWWRPAVAGAAVVVGILAWPVLMRVIGARNFSSKGTQLGAAPHRLRLVADGFAPYLHVLLVAVPVAVVAGLLLSGVRRAAGTGNDWWAWAALASGMVVVAGTYLIGSGDITVWVQGSEHRVTEYGAMMAWWIIAMWGIVASSAPVPLPAPSPITAGG